MLRRNPNGGFAFADRQETGRTQVGFAASAAAGPLGGATASGTAASGFRPPPKRSSTERTASRVLRSFTASSSGAEAGERRIRLSGSGKISGSSQGPCTTNGRSKLGVALAAEVRLATPFIPYSPPRTDAAPANTHPSPRPSQRLSPPAPKPP